jgi:hypothetical protein
MPALVEPWSRWETALLLLDKRNVQLFIDFLTKNSKSKQIRIINDQNSKHKKDGLVKSPKNRLGPSFRRTPESSCFRWLWTPAFAGVTGIGTFYDFVKKEFQIINFGTNHSKFRTFENLNFETVSNFGLPWRDS